MEAINTTPLIVIVGPTASGKTALAVDLAEQFGGEIICADSRTIYKHMNIGTAKPSDVDLRRVKHWGIDLVEPGELFTALDFKIYANKKINDIRSKGKIPFLVGGTGLYTDAVIYDFEFGSAADVSRRNELELLSLDELHEYCKKHAVMLPENSQNKRYVIRAIEKNGAHPGRREDPIDNCYIVGIATDRTILRARIAQRIEQMIAGGVVEEAMKLSKKYGWKNEAMTGNIYPLVKMYVDGELSVAEMKEKSIIRDWRLAKRQLTWLRRSGDVAWYELEAAQEYLSGVLARSTDS